MQSIKLVQCVVVVFYVVLVHLQEVHMVSDEDDANVNGRIIYDQRQSGKYNIHVVIKDVAIIEMGQNEIEDSSYNDEDYYYDDNDLTVKPITLNPPTTTTTTKKVTMPTLTTSTSRNERNPTTVKIESFDLNATPNMDKDTTINNQQTDETTFNPSSIFWNTLSSLVSKTTMKDSVVSLPSPTPFANHSGSKKQIITKYEDLKPRSKIEPILYASDDEDTIQNKSREDSIDIDTEPKIMKNSKIFKVKVHKSPHPPRNYSPLKIQSRRCRSYQYRDISGNCRSKRSPTGSLLNRLFSMLVTLPFVRGELHHNEDHQA
ncbi:uncharacterized protein LOC142227357 [Haematobia irritans]|uniref:uncharacterized protein LOC142227357 n=1 Tax=Haematobia irritans TaxID=7368 RepID=UPI003F4F5591